ncbi:phage tail tape measure protein [Pseudomonas guariconensis]|uniref:phage tail tape measure protein n=1 Tax=Pseudomonas guariconensis TaxID=1288410 RepID=UPI0023647A54|nr:phage tail tape measure protein [Pseudomonas guariconensis]MDD2092429.1 phage tail tape measure protein [Pseudomonas guariconensis]
MAQESRLAVTIDSRGAQRDAASMRKELDSLESSGNRVAPAMDKAGASIEGAGRRSDASSKWVGGLAAETDKLLGVVGGLAAPFAAAFSVSKIAQYSEQYTNLTNRLRLVTEGAEQLAFAQDSVYRVAQNSRQSLQSTAEVYQRVAQNARQLGLSFADVERVTETVSKTVALSGASAQAAEASMVQFGQALASGTLRGDELNSIMEQTPALAQAIARGLGVSIGQLRTLGAEGKLTSEAVVKALQSQKGKVDELSGSLQVTVSQSITAFNNSLVTTVGKLDEATGASARLARGIVSMAEAMDRFNSGEFLDFFRDDKQTVAGLNNELSVTLAGIRDLQNARSKLSSTDSSDTVFFKFKFYNREELDKEIAGLESRATSVRALVAQMQKTAAQPSLQTPQGDDPGKKVNAEYEKLLANLKKQAALEGENTEAAKVRYAIEAGELGKLLPEQEKLLLKYAQEKDAKAAAEKASKKAAAEEAKARAATGKGLSESLNTFSRLYAQYDPASQAARVLTKEQQQLDLAFQKGKISQEEYGKALAQASTNYAAAIKGAQGLTQAEQYRAQMERQLATQRMEYAAQADAVGMGQKDAARMQERLRIEQDTNNRILQLQTELANAQGEKQRQDLQAQIDIEREFLQKRVAAQREGWSQIDQAQADWSNGARGAFQDYMDSARDVAGQTRNLFSNAFGNMEDAVVNFVKTGKLSFKDFADQVVADLIRIQVRQAAAGFLGSALGFLGGGGGAAAAGSGTMTGFSETISRSGFAAGGYTGDGGKFEPKGVVHGGEYVVRKEVVSQPGMRDHLDRLNRKGYASGGYVEPAAIATQSSSVLPANQTGLPPIVQHISVQGTADDATLARIQQAAQKGAQDGYNLVLRDLKTNGPARQLIARNR